MNADYNLTESQRYVLTRLVQKAREGCFNAEDFVFTWTRDGAELLGCEGEFTDVKEITLDVLESEGLLYIRKGTHGMYRCSLRPKAYEAVDSDFGTREGRKDDSITIEFTNDRWGQITPIGLALSSTLGKEFIVEKSAERIVVKLSSPDQLQAALDAVIPVLVHEGESSSLPERIVKSERVKPLCQCSQVSRLARLGTNFHPAVLVALESTSSGDVGRVTISKKGGYQEEIAEADIQTILQYLSHRFDEEFPLDRAKMSLRQESAIEAVRGLPWVGDVFALWVKRWMESKEKAVSPGIEVNRASRQIYGHFRQFFKDPSRQLPPASEDET